MGMAVKPILFPQQKYDVGSNSEGHGANQGHSLQELVETRSQRPQGLSFSLVSCAREGDGGVWGGLLLIREQGIVPHGMALMAAG